MLSFLFYIGTFFLRLLITSGTQEQPILFPFQNSAWVAPIWADTLHSSASFTAEGIEKGRRIYFRQCVVCHGNNGKGDGESGFGLDVPPGDLTDAHTKAESDGSLFWKISNGREPMPEFNSKLSEPEKWQVVSWIRFMQQNPPVKHKHKKK